MFDDTFHPSQRRRDLDTLLRERACKHSAPYSQGGGVLQENKAMPKSGCVCLRKPPVRMDSNGIAGLAFVFDVSRVTHFSAKLAARACYNLQKERRFVFDDGFHPSL